ncbi:MAG TPA: SdrD B-like domain-containing protein [Tepidisphaeraceae bacterium]|nr:SdrD B-like domain-containing protein [Tepidisphaeraceae bacterium]
MSRTLLFKRDRDQFVIQPPAKPPAGGRRRRAVAHAAANIVEGLEARTLLSAAPNLGINIRRLGFDSGDELFADAMKEPSFWTNDLANPTDTSSRTPIDTNGWPTTDSGIEVINTTSDNGGTYALSFTGQATVSAPAADPNIQVVNVSYDPTSNTTTGQVVVPAGLQQVMLDFTNTRRLPTDTTATGVSNVQLMRPISPDSSTSYAPGTLFSTPIQNLIANFSTIRYMDYTLTNSNPQVNWSDRTLPSQIQTGGVGGAWEYAVALANQTGKDMWINIPEMATNQYITNLAELIDYGSDGVNPYTGPQGSAVSAANPNPVPASGAVWAGLNPNLHVYVEYSNEVWNNSFAQNAENTSAAIAEVNAGGSGLNYDGSTSTAVWAARRTAERTAITSNLFRGVFGDSRMMTEVRPVYQWQYGNLNDTAAFGLEFLNNYYDNADGLQHVQFPHPVNYYLWGGGGGWYGGVSNPNGTGDVIIADAGFSSPAVSGFQTDPAGGSWSFSGNAGIAANGSSLGNPNSTSGTQAAYLQAGGSFTQTVNFSGGLADLTFSAAVFGSESFSVSIDGTDYSVPWTLSSSYSAQRTAVFDTGVSAGPHTVTFTASGGTGTAFISNVVAETANGMYAGGIQDITSTTRNEVAWATAFGLQMVSYEGGFNFGSGDVGTPLQIDANQDPRAEQAAISQMDEFFAAGGALGMYYDTTNHIWALTLDVNNQNTPKIAAVQSVLAAPQVPLNVGATLPTTLGQSITIANSLGAGAGAPGIYMFDAPAAGTYSLTLSGKQSGSISEKFILDGNLIPGSTTLPTAATGNSAPLNFTITTPGLHAIQLLTSGSGSISPNNPAGSITVTSGAVTTPPSPTISGTVFNDTNHDGVMDDGETGVAGVRVYEDPNYNHAWDSASEQSVVTDVNGNFTFSNLPADPEILRIILPSGATQTFPAGGIGQYVGKNLTQSLSGVNFGISLPVVANASISGTVFNDINGDGIQDNGEPGLSGVVVELNTSINGGHPAAQTDANGNFTIGNLPPGTYTVSEILPGGDVQTTPASGGITVTLAASQASSGVDFGVTIPPPPQFGSISGSVFSDANDDGAQDNGEGGAAGIAVYADVDNLGVFSGSDPSTFTDANGNYTLNNVPAGSTVVRLILPAGDSQTAPFLSNGVAVNVAANQTTAAPQALGIYIPPGPPPGIYGTVFNDANRDGVQDNGETGIANVLVYADPNYNHKPDVGEAYETTDANGNFFFPYPLNNPQILRIVLPSGAQQTFPAGGIGNYVGNPTQALTNENFGVYIPAAGGSTGSITGSVFNDLNADHVKTSNEPNLAGQTVYIDANNDGKLDAGDPTAITNSAGAFTFTGLAAGSYTVSVSLAPGYRQTPIGSTGTKVTVVANKTVSAGAFSVTTSAYVGGTLFNDLNGNGIQNSGEAGLAGYKVYIDLNNDGVFESNEPSDVTTSVGYWYFRSVAPGTYTIRVVAPSGWTTTHAYTVTLGSGAYVVNGAIGIKKG